MKEGGKKPVYVGKLVNSEVRDRAVRAIMNNCQDSVAVHVCDRQQRMAREDVLMEIRFAIRSATVDAVPREPEATT